MISPFYIEPRKGPSHIDLNGAWTFTWEDAVTDHPDFSENAYPAALPGSVYYHLYEAGVLPHPYQNDYAKRYVWVRDKAWYYKKTFFLDKRFEDREALLCFDGVSYACRIWINGACAGGHEGMFGGPIVKANPYLRFGGENELVVEVKAASFGDPNFTTRNTNGTNTQIVPWCTAGDRESGSQDFVVVGLWRSVRMELLHKRHLSRPVITTEEISGGAAVLRLETEILDGRIDELSVDTGIDSGCYGYTRAFDGGSTGVKSAETVTLSVCIREKDTGNEALSFTDEIALNDREQSGIHPDYWSPQFFEKSFSLHTPRLWYPHNLGRPFLYEACLRLFEKGRQVDELTFDFGVRTIRLLRTEGEKLRHRWGKFQFEVNGKRFFLKGMNHMPVDFLYREDAGEIRWVVETAKHAGIGLLRVWNGGGGPESELFYHMCDQYGILVWQDWFLANMEAPNYPQDVLEEQMQLNLYRIRNHPSLAVHCGGNEFNPYARGNAAAMYVMLRSVEDLDPLRPFIRTTADGGDAHIYRDFEPIWFQKRYRSLPFVGESGIHSFPLASTLKKWIPDEEYERLEKRLPDLFNRKEMEKFPSFLGHFVEYVPERIPRMIARASTIANPKGISLSGFAEATQLAAFEFYQMMLFAMRDNYPNTSGVMPWVYKRPWPTVAIQCVDGMGYPIAAYYAVRNAYGAVSVMLRLEELTYAPGEDVPLQAVIFNDGEEAVRGSLTVTVYSPMLQADWKAEIPADIPAGSAKSEVFCGRFSIPKTYAQGAFLITVQFQTREGRRYKTVYWPKCLTCLENETQRVLRRIQPQKNPIYDQGPWLRETVTAAGKTSVEAVRLRTDRLEGRLLLTVQVKNTGGLPAFPVCFDTSGLPPFYADDNYFLLDPGEEREVTLVIRGECVQAELPVVVAGWNFDPVTL